MKYFTIKELTKSDTAAASGIDNMPSAAVVAALTALADEVLDPARAVYGQPVYVSSGYRCAKLNAIVGGAVGSQHCKGEAADLFTLQGITGNRRLAEIIFRQRRYDQLILEGVDPDDPEERPAWVHVSYRADGHNRRECLIKYTGTKRYSKYYGFGGHKSETS